MIRIKHRFRNAFDLIRGPYRKKTTTQVQIDTQDLGGKISSQIVDLTMLREGVSTGIADFLPVQIRLVGEQFHINLPQHSVIQRATMTGWKTIWDGATASFQEQRRPNQFELSIPAYGWWKLSSHASCVEVYPIIRGGSEDGVRPSIFAIIKSMLFNDGSKSMFGASAIHALVFAIALNGLFLKSAIISRLTSSPAEEQQEQKEQQAAAAAAEQIQVSGLEDERGFNGTSIFKALYKKTEENFKVDDVKDSLKGLSNLLKSPGQIKVAVNAKAPKPTTGVSNMVQSLKSLQSGIAQRPGVAGVAVAKVGTANVNWKSQFQVGGTGSGGSDKSGRALTEGQQKMVLEVFSKLQDKFRGCYETALLKFDEMAVTVSFEGEINAEGRIGRSTFSVSGRSTPDSQDALVNCLKGVMGQAKLDGKLSGIKIKNQFIFKS